MREDSMRELQSCESPLSRGLVPINEIPGSRTAMSTRFASANHWHNDVERFRSKRQAPQIGWHKMGVLMLIQVAVRRVDGQAQVHADHGCAVGQGNLRKSSHAAA